MSTHLVCIPEGQLLYEEETLARLGFKVLSRIPKLFFSAPLTQPFLQTPPDPPFLYGSPSKAHSVKHTHLKGAHLMDIYMVVHLCVHHLDQDAEHSQWAWLSFSCAL